MGGTNLGDAMSASAIATIIAAVIAALAAVLSGWYAQQSVSSARRTAAEERAVRFREPLLQAAFNLQSRLYNIARKKLLQCFKDEERPGDCEYTINNTLYLIGQYLCWVEIVRRESQFLDPASQEHEQALADQLERVREAFAVSDGVPRELRVFRGQQRAIGELMLEPVAAGAHPDWPRWDCMGFACFFERMDQAPLARWLLPLKTDLEAMRSDPTLGMERLTTIQHELIALVQLLDPAAQRTSGRMREPL